MNIADRLGILNTKTAVCRAEKVISATVGKLKLTVLKNYSGVFRQENCTVQKPIIALRLVFGLAARYYHDAVIVSTEYCCIQYFTVVVS